MRAVTRANFTVISFTSQVFSRPDHAVPTAGVARHTARHSFGATPPVSVENALSRLNTTIGGRPPWSGVLGPWPALASDCDFVPLQDVPSSESIEPEDVTVAGRFEGLDELVVLVGPELSVQFGQQGPQPGRD
jgi:hypothetical protein